jgi:hypothetical protein
MHHARLLAVAVAVMGCALAVARASTPDPLAPDIGDPVPMDVKDRIGRHNVRLISRPAGAQAIRLHQTQHGPRTYAVGEKRPLSPDLIARLSSILLNADNYRSQVFRRPDGLPLPSLSVLDLGDGFSPLLDFAIESFPGDAELRKLRKLRE